MSNKNKLHETQLMILKEVKRVCDKHEIKYFLDAGTLLGAIRHKGFIPWDDDLDIGMLKEEYEKFLNVAKHELGKEYFLQELNMDKNYPFPYAKIRLNNTKYIENKSVNAKGNKGIFIDIFPYINIPKSSASRKKFKLLMGIWFRLLLMKNNYTPWNGENIKVKIIYIPFRIASKFISKNFIINKINEMEKSVEGVGYVAVHDGISYDRWSFKKGDLNEFIYKKFEDEYYPVPKKYDEILKKMYGNYIEYPPENERENKHQIVCLDYGKYS